MENNRREQKGEAANTQAEQNETLHQKGARVSDYGNVTGGSAVPEEKSERNNENRSGDNTSGTIGNP